MKPLPRKAQSHLHSKSKKRKVNRAHQRKIKILLEEACLQEQNEGDKNWRKRAHTKRLKKMCRTKEDQPGGKTTLSGVLGKEVEVVRSLHPHLSIQCEDQEHSQDHEDLQKGGNTQEIHTVGLRSNHHHGPPQDGLPTLGVLRGSTRHRNRRHQPQRG